jgi:hypothetical protein
VHRVLGDAQVRAGQHLLELARVGHADVREVDLRGDLAGDQPQPVVRVGQPDLAAAVEHLGGDLEDRAAQPAHLRLAVQEARAEDDVVTLLDLLDHAEQVLGLVLAVGVERRDVLRVGEALRRVEPRLQGPALPEVDRVGDAHRARLVDLVGGVVGAAVVDGDHDHPEVDELLDDARHDRGLVVDRHDDRGLSTPRQRRQGDG